MCVKWLLGKQLFCIGTQMPVVHCECGKCSRSPEIARLEQEGLCSAVWCM